MIKYTTQQMIDEFKLEIWKTDHICLSKRCLKKAEHKFKKHILFIIFLKSIGMKSSTEKLILW